MLDEVYQEFMDAIVELDIDRMTICSSPYLSSENIKKRSFLKAKKEVKKISKTIEESWNVLSIFFKEKKTSFPADVVKKILKKILVLKNVRKKEEFQSSFKKEAQNFWGTSIAEREQLYQFSKKLIEEKQWEKADKINYIFVMLFPQIPEFWINIGITERYFF